MRVAIELTALELDRGGTVRAIEQLLPRLRSDGRVELTEFAHSGSPNSGGTGGLLRGLSRELRYMPSTLPKQANASGCELLHCTSPLVPIKCELPLVVTLFDAIGWDHPEWLTRTNVLQLKHVFSRSVHNNNATIITSSEYSKGRIAEALRIDPSRVVSAPLGLDRRFSASRAPEDERRLAELGLEGRFILTVGTLQPRKNVEAAIEAFERLEGRDGLKLVIVGARGWGDDELLRRIASSPASSDIHALGRVDDAELLALYRGAECLVYPSRYEGFGFPPLEAMACGTPVLSTTNTSLAEAVGDAAIELDPDDPDQIADAIGRVLASEQLAAELVSKGLAHSAKFTWERCLDLTIEAYELALSR